MNNARKYEGKYNDNAEGIRIDIIKSWEGKYLYKNFPINKEDESNLFKLLHYYKMQISKKTEDQGACQSLLKKIIDIRNQIITNNIGLIYKFAKNFSEKTSLATIDDLASEGYEALIHASEAFDPWHGTQFSTYASWSIIRAIKRTLGNLSKSNQHYIPSGEDPYIISTELESESSYDMPDVQLTKLISILENNTAELTDVEQLVISEYFHLFSDRSDIPKVTFADIGTITPLVGAKSLTGSRIHQIYKSALKKIENAINSD